MKLPHFQSPAAGVLLRTGVVIAGVLCATVTAWTAPTDLATEPLASPVANTKPNIMFVLDDSGSMAWDYSPDYVNDNLCFDTKDTSNNITGSLTGCVVGDPPYMAAQFNKQYYNPAITYRPGLNYDNTEKTNMNAANTSNWTAVPTDPYGQQQFDQRGNNVTTANLATGYPDRVWCTAQSDTATDTTVCKTNSAYTYPDTTFGYGKTTGGSIKYITGAPYYYTIGATTYCTDKTLSNCNAQTGPDASYPEPAPVRYCTGTNPLTQTFATCYAKKITLGGNNYTYPSFLGKVTAGAAAVVAASASGTLTINSGASSSVTISKIEVDENGTLKRITDPAGGGIASGNSSMTGGTITASTGTNSNTDRSNAAEVIRLAINAYTATSGYSATRSGSVVTITRGTTGASGNGFNVIVTAPATGGTASTGTLTINTVASGSTITVSVNGVNISGATPVSCNLTNSSANRNTCAANLVAAINTFTSTPDYTASRSNAVVTITAPISMGATPNGWAVSNSGTVAVSAVGNMAGGVTASMPYSTTAFSGGTDASPAGTDVRSLVGTFNRVNIVSGGTFVRASTRSDCAGTTCTYAEEMTNFANWYSYYRTRMQMMKSAAGRAFGPIDDSFRVGFITINPGSTVSSSKYLKIDTYNTSHKQAWYSKFYATTTGSSTPLREALSRVGWIYAGKLNTGLTTGISTSDDPVQYSCQPNFTILSTDGYWNGNGSQNLSGSAIGNMDSDPNNAYSKFVAVATGSPPVAASEGVYEGSGAASTGSLSDVAQYYYVTDLRSSMQDNVRARGRDRAPHQHMTTFTIGLGLDGELTYPNSNYETSTSGDFYDIRRGAKTWPVPVADSPSALDDLWHTAVNGRGTFYSASNPEELVNGLVDALNTLQAALGAGASAATSNLRPVAGDNFAFAGEYTSVEWTGDIKAYTIDLGTGAVSKNALWSARALLDARDFKTRQIYTFDAGDVSAGNGLRHFCVSGSPGSGCTDGSGLTATELAFFNPNRLYQYSGWTAGKKAVSAGALVDFIRGDTANEDSGSGLDTDRFRNRSSVLGDIVGSKPAYVKEATFSYSDTGYSAFVACTLGTGTGCPAAQFPTPTSPRRPTVYVSSNDGMLHAFETDVNNNAYYQTGGITTDTTSDDTFNGGNNSGNGVERWAYIPSFIIPNLYALANDPYTHRYLNDGSPVVSDICISTPCAGLADWRTILVANIGGAGRGYYALDVTNPLAPKGLWEINNNDAPCLNATQVTSGTYTTDCYLGYAYGNPVITKRKSDGKWVVLITSGYNNQPVVGQTNLPDGKGYLYVIEAATGKILDRIGTGVGTAGTSAASYADANPAGLARIAAWAENPLVDNTALAVYGGDLYGNMWRFDLDSTSTGYRTATKVFTTPVTNGKAQPITGRPDLTKIQGKRVIAFATGQFLGVSDKATTYSNSVYAVYDDLSSTAATRGALVQNFLVPDSPGSANRAVSSGKTVNTTLWSGSNRGWFADLPGSTGATVNSPSERAFLDVLIQAGTLAVVSSAPDSSDACSAGGFSWANTFDIATGTLPAGILSLIASQRITGLVVGFTLIQLPNGQVRVVLRLADGSTVVVDAPVSSGTYGGRRVSWRELTGPPQ